MAKSIGIDIAVNTGHVATSTNDLAQSIGDVGQSAQQADKDLADLAQTAQQADKDLSDLSQTAQQADKDLADLSKTLNDFLERRAKSMGKQVRLFDLDADRQELEEIKGKFQEVINLNPSIRQHLQASGQTGKARPIVPSKINLVSISSSEAAQQKYLDNLITKLLSHHFATKNTPPDTRGLTSEELTGRHIRVAGRNDEEGEGRNRKPISPLEHGARVIDSMVQRTTPATGWAGELAHQTIAGGVDGAQGVGIGGFLGGGLKGALGGAGIMAGLYGLFKLAGVAGDAIDQNKKEATEIDQLRRSMGGMADSFDELKNKSRMLGEMYAVLPDEARNAFRGFINLAKTGTGAFEQTSEGIALSKAAGVDSSTGVNFLANARRYGSINETQKSARIYAVQFAEALARTGSTLNAGELTRVIGDYTKQSSQNSLGTAAFEQYAGILSAMVGTKNPGLDVQGAAGILGKADASFQAGGRMGEASNTLQFMAMEGDKVGLLGIKMRQNAGMFATANDVYQNPHSQINKYLGGEGMKKFHGDETGLEAVMKMADANVEDKQTRLMAIGNHFGLSPEATAALYNLRNEGKLQDTLKFAKERPDIKLEGMSAEGYVTLSAIAKNKGNMAGLQSIREGLAARSDLSEAQKTNLSGMASMKDTKPLEDALAKFANGMNREETLGEKIEKSAAETAAATGRMADKLTNVAVESRDILTEILRRFAPDNPMLKEMDAVRKRERATIKRDDIKNGNVPEPTIDKLRKDHFETLENARDNGSVQDADKALDDYFRQMGADAPVSLEMIAKQSFGQPFSFAVQVKKARDRARLEQSNPSAKDKLTARPPASRANAPAPSSAPTPPATASDAAPLPKTPVGNDSEALREKYFATLRKPIKRGSGVTGDSRRQALESYLSHVGSNAPLPQDIAELFPDSTIDEIRKKVESRQGKPATAPATAPVQTSTPTPVLDPSQAAPLPKTPVAERKVSHDVKNLAGESVVQRKKRFAPDVADAEDALRLPKNSLMALMMAENGKFDPNVTGQERGRNGKTYKSSAMGLTQITKGTWKDNVPQFRALFDRNPERMNPQDQIMMGGLILRKHLDDEHGNLVAANAAYHGGPGWRTSSDKNVRPESHMEHANKVMRNFNALNDQDDRMIEMPNSDPTAVQIPDQQIPSERQSNSGNTRISIDPINVSGQFSLNTPSESNQNQIIYTTGQGRARPSGAMPS